MRQNTAMMNNARTVETLKETGYRIRTIQYAPYEIKKLMT